MNEEERPEPPLSKPEKAVTAEHHEGTRRIPRISSISATLRVPSNQGFLTSPMPCSAEMLPP